mmetsp:Transcript_49833/g.147285  ORF Transcript_49833/g.147285 Transcript_49833/m.147285 type:complete len:206 (-) Transcript_49833:2993-3610(-)
MTSLSLSLSAASVLAALAPLPAPLPRPRPAFTFGFGAGLFWAVMDRTAFSYALKPEELWYSFISSSYLALASSYLSSYTFFSSGDRALHMLLISFADSAKVFPDSVERFSAAKKKYALCGRLGSLGASADPRNLSLAFCIFTLFSAWCFRRKYFFASAVFMKAFISLSYSAVSSLFLSWYCFWPSAPSSTQAFDASTRGLPTSWA